MFRCYSYTITRERINALPDDDVTVTLYHTIMAVFNIYKVVNKKTHNLNGSEQVQACTDPKSPPRYAIPTFLILCLLCVRFSVSHLIVLTTCKLHNLNIRNGIWSQSPPCVSVKLFHSFSTLFCRHAVKISTLRKFTIIVGVSNNIRSANFLSKSSHTEAAILSSV